jgi:hypothetical protein
MQQRDHGFFIECPEREFLFVHGFFLFFQGK